MSYERQNFEDGKVLTAAQLNHIEDALVELMNGGGSSTSRIVEVHLPSSAWDGADNLHYQVISVEGITEYSKVDLLPSVEQLAVFYNKDVTFVTENEDGVVTVYAIGEKPLLDYTMQAQITEVAV